MVALLEDGTCPNNGEKNDNSKRDGLDRRSQRSEVRGQRSEVRGQGSEVRGQKSEVRSLKSIRGRAKNLDQGASLECGDPPPQRGCRAGDPGRRRFGPRRPGAASWRNINPQRLWRCTVGPKRRLAAALQGGARIRKAWAHSLEFKL